MTEEREILSPKTSNEDLFEQYEAISDGGKPDCAGNISHGCVRESLNTLSEALGTEREDWTLIGGIVPQIVMLNREGEQNPELMREYGDRVTNDVDILTTSPSDIRGLINDSSYDEQTMLNIDNVDPSIMGEGEKVIENSEYRHFQAYEDEPTPLDAYLRVPDDPHLFYTKVHDKNSREEKKGTMTDAEIMAYSGIYDVAQNDEGTDLIADLLRGNPEAQDYVHQLDI